MLFCDTGIQNAICFPVFSSSLVDYYGERKPAYKVVRQSYEPVQCILADGKIYIVNDGGYVGKAELRLTDGDGEILFGEEIWLDGAEVFVAGERNAEEGTIIFSELKFGDKIVRNYVYIYDQKIDYVRYREHAEKIYGKV